MKWQHLSLTQFVIYYMYIILGENQVQLLTQQISRLGMRAGNEKYLHQCDVPVP